MQISDREFPIDGFFSYYICLIAFRVKKKSIILHFPWGQGVNGSHFWSIESGARASRDENQLRKEIQEIHTKKMFFFNALARVRAYMTRVTRKYDKTAQVECDTS